MYGNSQKLLTQLTYKMYIPRETFLASLSTLRISVSGSVVPVLKGSK